MVLDRLVGCPVRIHPNGKEVHKLITVAGGDVISLDNSRVLVVGKVVQAASNEVGGNNLVAIQNDKIVKVGRFEVVIEIARLVTDVVVAADHFDIVHSGEIIDGPDVGLFFGVVQNNYLVIRVILVEAGFEALGVKIVAGAVHHSDFHFGFVAELFTPVA